MLTAYGVAEGRLEERQAIGPRSFVRLIEPTEWELAYAAKACRGVDLDDLHVALDDDEPSRFEDHGSYSLLVVDVPVPAHHEKTDGYRTYPLSTVITSKGTVVATSRIGFPEAADAQAASRRVTIADGKPRYLYDLLMTIAVAYQRYLRAIEARRSELVEALNGRTSTDDLVALHGLETDIVYLETSLSANRAALERAAKSSRILADDADHDLFDDLLIEIRQADEMAQTYRQLISSTRELFSSVMDNGLNATMKLLAAITIVLAIPTMIAGFYGMNVAAAGMPLSESPLGFVAVIAFSFVVCAVAVALLKKRNLL